MMDQLPPEVIGMIVAQTKTVDLECGRQRNETSFADQAKLLPLLHVSKTFEAQTILALYRDPIIAGLECLLFIAIHTPKHLTHVRRLRLCRGSHDQSNKYLTRLKEVGWHPVQRKRSILLSPYHEIHHNEQLTSLLYIRAEIGPILPNLERVVLEPEINQCWVAQVGSKPPKPPTNCYSLPLFLANLPSVQHYCQHPVVSPFALAQDTFKLSNPPLIATYHVYYDSWFFRGYTIPAESGRFPIILGTVNRYMFENDWNTIEIDGETGEAMGAETTEEEIRKQLNPITTSILRDTVVVKDNYRSSDIRSEPVSDLSLEGTVLELHGHLSWKIRHPSAHSATSPLSSSPVDELKEHHEAIYNIELSRIQQIIDEIFETESLRRWKGKVVLVSDKVTPPCTACILDLAQQKQLRARTYEADMEDDARYIPTYGSDYEHSDGGPPETEFE